jgi:hypothetical protein
VRAKRPVAGEGELAAGRPLAALVHHAADAVRISRVPDAVEDDLRHRPAAVDAFGRRFVVDRLGQAVDRPQAADLVGAQLEGQGGSGGHRLDRPLGIELLRFLGGEGPEQVGRRKLRNGRGTRLPAAAGLPGAAPAGPGGRWMSSTPATACRDQQQARPGQAQRPCVRRPSARRRPGVAPGRVRCRAPVGVMVSINAPRCLGDRGRRAGRCAALRPDSAATCAWGRRPGDGPTRG